MFLEQCLIVVCSFCVARVKCVCTMFECSLLFLCGQSHRVKLWSQIWGALGGNGYIITGCMYLKKEQCSTFYMECHSTGSQMPETKPTLMNHCRSLMAIHVFQSTSTCASKIADEGTLTNINPYFSRQCQVINYLFGVCYVVVDKTKLR